MGGLCWASRKAGSVVLYRNTRTYMPDNESGVFVREMLIFGELAKVSLKKEVKNHAKSILTNCNGREY